MSNVKRFAKLINEAQLLQLNETSFLGSDMLNISVAMNERSAEETIKAFYSSLNSNYELNEGVIESIKKFTATKLVSGAVKTLIVSAKAVVAAAGVLGIAIGTTLIADITKIKDLGDKLMAAVGNKDAFKSAAESFYGHLQTATFNVLGYIDGVVTKGKEVAVDAIALAKTHTPKMEEIKSGIVNSYNNTKEYLLNTFDSLTGTQRIVILSLGAIIGLLFIALKVTKLVKSGKNNIDETVSDATAVAAVTSKVVMDQTKVQPKPAKAKK